MSSLSKRRGGKALRIQTPSQNLEVCNEDFLSAYEILPEVLGYGTFAVVKRAVRKADNRRVAIKIMRADGDSETIREIRMEYELMRKCTHPYIVESYDFFVSPNLSAVYLCMELVEGQTLKGHVERRGAIAMAVMRPLIGQLVSAVCYIHCKRIMHRDISSGNLLIDNDLQRLRLCDFNVAIHLQNSISLTPRIGTLPYAPPEVLLGHGTLRERVDIWGIGVCLYFAFSGGKTPGHGRNDREVLGRYLANVSPKERRTWISDLGLHDGHWRPSHSLAAEVLWGCLNPDPAQRPDPIMLLWHPWVSGARMDLREETRSFRSKVAAISSCAERLCSHGFRLRRPQRNVEVKSSLQVNTRSIASSVTPDTPLLKARSLSCSTLSDLLWGIHREEFNKSMSAKDRILPKENLVMRRSISKDSSYVCGTISRPLGSSLTINVHAFEGEDLPPLLAHDCFYHGAGHSAEGLRGAGSPNALTNGLHPKPKGSAVNGGYNGNKLRTCEVLAGE